MYLKKNLAPEQSLVGDGAGDIDSPQFICGRAQWRAAVSPNLQEFGVICTMKVLFVATVRSHIGQFHMPIIRELVRRGCRVEAAFKDNSADKPGLDLSGIARTYEVPFSRSPYSVDNLKAYQVLKKIIDEVGTTPFIATRLWGLW